MVIRIFRAKPRPGGAAEFVELLQEVSIPFVDGQPGLVGRYAGGVGTTGGELVLVTVWESLEALKNVTGEEWDSAVIPDPRQAELLEECFDHHYKSLG